MSIKPEVPSLATLAAQTIIKQPEKCIQSYRTSSYNRFTVTVGHMTEFDLQMLRLDLAKLDLPPSVQIYVTGSDAKLEKSNRIESPIELVILCSSSDKELIEGRINHFVKGRLLTMDQDLEWKPPSEDLSFCSCTKSVIPSRLMHKTAIIGKQSQLDSLNEPFVQEVQNMPAPTLKQFRQKFVNRHTNQLKNVRAGTETHDVDLTAGILSYSGMGRKATKYSLLRPIQYTLDLVLINHMRTKKLSSKEYAQWITEMPKTVPEQIQYMFDKGLLPKLKKQDVADLQAAYKLGLFYFQIGQHLFSVDPKKRPVSFGIPDALELKKAYLDTERILKLM